nr:hypothetical protein [Arthrobacter silvisoli]
MLDLPVFTANEPALAKLHFQGQDTNGTEVSGACCWLPEGIGCTVVGNQHNYLVAAFPEEAGDVVGVVVQFSWLGADRSPADFFTVDVQDVAGVRG